MPLSLGAAQSVDYFIDAKDDLGFFTATLGNGQTISVVSSDPATVVLTPDTTVRKAPDGTVWRSERQGCIGETACTARSRHKHHSLGPEC